MYVETVEEAAPEGFEMQMLYDSDCFVVVYVATKNTSGATEQFFEIARKKEADSVLLSGELRKAFAACIEAWQANTPHQEEVEATLDRFTQLGMQPLVMH
jgi:hypothetical protein